MTGLQCFSFIFQMVSLQERVSKLTKQWNELNETRGQRDITQEFALRSKLRDIHHANKVPHFISLPSCHII